jgi:hypothetical protein
MILHLVRRRADGYPLRIAKQGQHAVLLVGDAVRNEALGGLVIYSSAACARQRNATPPGTPLEDPGIVDLIAQAEQVIAW